MEESNKSNIDSYHEIVVGIAIILIFVAFRVGMIYQRNYTLREECTCEVAKKYERIKRQEAMVDSLEKIIENQE